MRRPSARARGVRALQIGLLVLLLVCFAQVLWWYVDQVLHSAHDRSQALAACEVERRAAEQLLQQGTAAAQIEGLFPRLEVASGGVRIRPEVERELAEARFHRLRRYAWEGGFFLAVLGASMGVLWNALRREEELRRRQQNFIAAVTHELRSPLASLRLSAETMALRELAPERSRTLLKRILSDLQRMEDLVAKVLDTSRLERGRLELRPRRLALAPVVEEVVRELSGAAERGRVRVEVRVDSELAVHGDPTAAHMVVRNLLENAVKATAAQGGGRVLLTGSRDERQVHLEVRDDGVGFPPGEGARLFERFYRSGDELRRRFSGTGLGLFLVERLMGLEHGRVTAWSEGEGQGAVFTVSWYLPPGKEA